MLKPSLLLLLLLAGTQLIGMSATLSNISDLQTFLRAEVYTSNFRPVRFVYFVRSHLDCFVKLSVFTYIFLFVINMESLCVGYYCFCCCTSEY